MHNKAGGRCAVLAKCAEQILLDQTFQYTLKLARRARYRAHAPPYRAALGGLFRRTRLDGRVFGGQFYHWTVPARHCSSRSTDQRSHAPRPSWASFSAKS